MYWLSAFCVLSYLVLRRSINCVLYILLHSAVALSVFFYISLSESVFFHYQRIEYWAGQSTVYRPDAVARRSLPDIEYFGGWSGLGYHRCPPLWQGCTICQGNYKRDIIRIRNIFWGSHKILILPVKGPGNFVFGWVGMGMPWRARIYTRPCKIDRFCHQWQHIISFVNTYYQRNAYTRPLEGVILPRSIFGKG